MPSTKQMLNIDANAKTVKGQSQGYLTGVLYFAPGSLSGVNLCVHATDKCLELCLNTAGMGIFSNVQAARIAKTKQYLKDRKAFNAILEKNITSLVKKAAKNGFVPCVRLNGTSDIAWEHSGLMEKFPNIQFYDYTKNPHRMTTYLAGKMPKNYHLTFSLSENNMDSSMTILSQGGNVAMVFDTKKKESLPDTYLGYRVINGDESDLRFLDPKGVIVGLRAKGKARQDKSPNGFIQRVRNVTDKPKLKLAA